MKRVADAVNGAADAREEHAPDDVRGVPYARRRAADVLRGTAVGGIGAADVVREAERLCDIVGGLVYGSKTTEQQRT